MKISAKTLQENFFHNPMDGSTDSSVNNFSNDWSNGYVPQKNTTSGGSQNQSNDWHVPDYKDYDIDSNDWKDIIEKTKKQEDKGGEIHREVDESDYLILTVERLEKEIGDLTKEVIDRMSHWVLTCVNCGFKDTLKEFSHYRTSWSLKCPSCQSKAVGIPKEEEHKLIKEILKGTEDERN